MSVAVVELEALRDAWQERWPAALELWSPFTRLRDPIWCLTKQDEAKAGLSGSFAMIRLVDQSVVISIRQVAERLAAFPLEVLGHEIGHHILCPADLSDNARMIARMQRALPTIEDKAPFVGNCYGDLLINDRLQRSRGLNMAGVYLALAGDDGDEDQDPFWQFYMRIYEILWALESRTLVRGTVSDKLEGDAQLGARLVRSFASRWLDGAGHFAALCFPYLLDEHDPEQARVAKALRDATGAGAGGMPAGLTEVDTDEEAGATHPALDPEYDRPAPASAAPNGAPGGQYREPFEYGQVLRATGLDLDDHEVAIRYYRERAMGHLVPFPSRPAPIATDPLPEGVEQWDVGEPLADIDWLETVLRSPIVVPGATTVQRVWGTSAGTEPNRVPLDLDLYVDSSGSMPNPQITTSYLALAGAIVALSALRAGGRVHVTLWSGTNQFKMTSGFITDEHTILAVLTDFIGGATAFPLHVFRDTYATRRADDRPAHVLVVSDDGVDTIWEPDERGRPGREVSNHALAAAGGGGTMVLNLYEEIEKNVALKGLRDDGWDINVVRDWAEVVAFRARLQSPAVRYGRNVMNDPQRGPQVEVLMRRLADTPKDFLGDPALAPAIVSDVLVMLGAAPLGIEDFGPLREPSRRNWLQLVMIASWLLAAPSLREIADSDRAWTFLRGGLQEVAGVVPAADFVSDPDRREELARRCLRALGLLPAGETEAQAADRLSTLDSNERARVIEAARAAEERAAEVRRAMHAKAAAEAAAKAARE